MSDGLEELDRRRGRWAPSGGEGRPEPAPVSPPPRKPRRPRNPARNRADAAATAPEGVPPPIGPEEPADAVAALLAARGPQPGGHRQVVYLSTEQMEWVRRLQIQALEAGHRLTVTEIIRTAVDIARGAR